LGRLWTRPAPAPEVPAIPAATPADLDTLWQRAYAQALAASNGERMARRIADDVVSQVRARDNEVAS
jgi:hypothetical protein